MILNEKHQYVAPDMKVTPIRVESGICSASAQITNEQIQQGAIENQTVNTDFKPTFDSSGADNGWDVTTASNN